MENQKINSDKSEEKKLNDNHYLIPSKKRLYKSPYNYFLFGVCGGIADYLNINPLLLRLIFVLTAVLGGWGIIAYAVCFVLIPEHPSAKEKGFANRLFTQRAFGFILIGIGLYYWLPPFGIFNFVREISITKSLFLSGLIIIFGIIVFINIPKKRVDEKILPSRIYRNNKDKRLLGVCAGLADYLQTDVNLIRILFILVSFITLGLSFLFYLIVGIFLKPGENAEVNSG